MNKKSHLVLASLALALSGPVCAVEIRSDTVLVPGTDQLDFESGSVGGVSPTMDIFWEQVTATTRRIRLPTGSSGGLLALDGADFSTISEADLMAYAYTSSPIDGPPGSSWLDAGDVFAVRTAEGNFAKVMVMGYEVYNDHEFYDIRLQYELFDGSPAVNAIPEPGSLALAMSGLGLAAACNRRRTSRSSSPRAVGDLVPS